MVHSRKYQKILVTGGAGFTGSDIVGKLVEKEFEVTVLDNLGTGHIKNIESCKNKQDFHFIKGDIRNFNLVEETMKDMNVVGWSTYDS
jgi:UDP-glucose 4-epimerase